MTSDSSESPMLLTPESTGTSGLTCVTDLSPPPSPNTLAVRKARRQTAFYPNMNSSNKQQKPFSRSAAKRESVMALGSIEHLQHYFTKTGLSAKKNPLSKPHHGLVPAIGGLHIPTSPPSANQYKEFVMPPSPAVPHPPARPQFSPHVKTHEVDPESLLPGVIEDLTAVAQAWCLDGNLEPDHFDVLEVLKTTTRAVRSTRNYLLSLPDESTGTIRAQFRPKILTPAPVKLRQSRSGTNLAAAAATAASTSSATASQQPDPLVLIRRAALEVLTVLRQMEESCRLPLDDDAYDAGSDGGGAHAALSDTDGSQPQYYPDPRNGGFDPDASMSFSLVQVQGRDESVPVWEDEEEDVFAIDTEEAKEKRERWDERLVLGSGWLYKQDVKPSDLKKERDIVAAYLDIVDEVLFESKKGEGRGWERVKKEREVRAVSRAAKNRRASSGDVAERTSAERDLRRRGSSDMVSFMRGLSISEEPDSILEVHEEEDEGDGEDELEDDELPDWAKRNLFEHNRLARAHAFLVYFLPAELRAYLAPLSTDRLSPDANAASGSRTAFLSSLTSGQLLCAAYNTCVRKSKKPWGFVSKDGVHDIIALEAAAAAEARDAGEDGTATKDASVKKGWTFRRTDNLRLWAGALKLRYMMPIQLPSQIIPSSSAPRQVLPTGNTSQSNTPLQNNTPLSSPSRSAFSGLPVIRRSDREPPILFDAQVVAKQESGWEDMLEGLLMTWINKAVAERRLVH